MSHDHSFDRCHPKAGRIFLAELCDSVMANGRVIYPGAFSDVLIASSPHIEAGTMITPYDKRNYLSVGEGSDAEGFREKVTTAILQSWIYSDSHLSKGTRIAFPIPKKRLSRRAWHTECSVANRL